jgi:hypothetical protein
MSIRKRIKVYRMVVVKPHGKTHLWRSKHKLEVNIKMDEGRNRMRTSKLDGAG